MPDILAITPPKVAVYQSAGGRFDSIAGRVIDNATNCSETGLRHVIVVVNWNVGSNYSTT